MRLGRSIKNNNNNKKRAKFKRDHKRKLLINFHLFDILKKNKLDPFDFQFIYPTLFSLFINEVAHLRPHFVVFLFPFCCFCSTGY